MTLALVLIVSALIATADQIIKYFVLRDLAPIGEVTVIDHLFSLIYVENRGAAFGIFQDQVWIFAVITFLMMGLFVYFIISGKFKGKLFSAATMLIIGGGIGNLIDRIFRGFVVDYLAVSFFPPVCNFADYCITVGAALFILSLILPQNREKLSANSVNNADTDHLGEPTANTESDDVK